MERYNSYGLNWLDGAHLVVTMPDLPPIARTRAVASVGPGGGGPGPPDKVLAPPGWPGAVYRKFPK